MVQIVGHRGADGYEARENTLPSFELAIHLGCDRAELDVMLSSDGEVVVIHDPQVLDTSGHMKEVREMTSQEIHNISIDGVEVVPSLQEVLDLCRDQIDLQIELKSPGTPMGVKTLLDRNHLSDQVVITSFDPELLRQMRAYDAQIKLGLLFDDMHEDVWRYVESIPLDFIGPKGQSVTQQMVDHAHKNGKSVYAFHVNDRKLGDRLVDMGVDELGTDYPLLFLGDR